MMAWVLRSVRDQRGQMTVEFALAFPVLLAVGFIAVNALVFMGDCAAFDLVARDAICLQADDPSNAADGCAQVAARIEQGLSMDHEAVSVEQENVGLGHVRYTATARFTPPFLQGVTVFGVSVPSLEHSVSFTVSPYRRGVVI